MWSDNHSSFSLRVAWSRPTAIASWVWIWKQRWVGFYFTYELSRPLTFTVVSPLPSQHICEGDRSTCGAEMCIQHAFTRKFDP